MNNLWSEALAAASGERPLRPSELDVHMIVRRVNGDRNHRVIEVLVSPDGFSGMGIVRTLDSHGYDQTYLFKYGGKGDDPAWMLLGIYQPGDPWPKQQTAV